MVKLNADKNSQLAALSDKLVQAETLAHEMEEKAELPAAESESDDCKDDDARQENTLEDQAKLLDEIEDIKKRMLKEK